MSTFNNSLNKGVPNDINIEMTFEEFLNFSSAHFRAKKNLKESVNSYYKQLEEKTGKSLRFLYALRYLTIHTNPDTLEKYITVSPEYFNGMLAMNLNLNPTTSKSINGEETEISDEDYLRQLKALKKVKSPQQLKRDFPALHIVYTELLEIKKELDPIKKRLSPFAYSLYLNQNNYTQKERQAIESVEPFDAFVKNMHETLSIMYEMKEELAALALEHTLDTTVFGETAAERLELFIADYYARLALSEDTDIETKQKCCYYLSAYMFEHENKLDEGESIQRNMGTITSDNIVKDERIIITKRSVYEKFKQVLIANPSLININFDSHDFENMTIDEINEIIAERMNKDHIRMQWDIVPEGCAIEFEEDIDRTKPGGASKKRKDVTDLFYQKKAFFESSDPILRIIGKESFDGYIGYIYPNGSVILDKFYENVSERKLARDVAIYCMDIDDFYRLCQYSKSEIIRDRLCKRFYHRGDWQARVKEQITGPALPNIDAKIFTLKQKSNADN